ncbi:hypothetical protein PBI_CHE12_43 [Mycobacterium phage Che12]|uniref:Uncharacterized protein n=1 Tax=Mycobacterium phage Che12 TaxID=2911435 RepID=Q1A0H4_9CAUD|nr:gp43 [Mycobacterium phage Che12]ABE67362.1 hypothetical protein PBI_CHE12_43 [Mycobacterium phage Che12]
MTDRAVYFDGFELPWYIAENGIHFKPGGRDGINTLTVEFFVGTTTFKDSWETEYWDEWFWLERLIRLQVDMELIALDRIIKEHL